MNKYIIYILFAGAFGLGFTAKTIIGTHTEKAALKKVTGIGGIFFKCKDPKKVKEWYKANLGLETNQFGASFEWREDSDSTKKGVTQWTPFAASTKYFDPSPSDFMIDYRVKNLTVLADELKKNGVVLTDTIETASYGKFLHILDVEGNKVELWEPK